MIICSHLEAVADWLSPDVLLGRMTALVGDHDLVNAEGHLVPKPSAAVFVQVVKNRPDLKKIIFNYIHTEDKFFFCLFWRKQIFQKF